MQHSEPTHVAFLGGGNMARALIGGLLRQAGGVLRIRVGEPLAATRAALAREFQVEAFADNASAINGAQLVVLAVKPQQAPAVLQDLRAVLLEQRPVLLSIAAGLRLADLTQACPPGVPIVRAMPNRPALVGAGVTGLYAAPTLSEAQRRLAECIVGASGRALWLRAETELDIVTALSGSGPAYFFLLAEHMARAAQALGLAPATAALLAAETLYGAGQLVHSAEAARTAGSAAEPGDRLAEQRLAVTSKGGTTEAALRVLQEGDFGALIARALCAAAARSAELAGTLAAPGDAAHLPDSQ